jgi:hypothetical protein
MKIEDIIKKGVFSFIIGFIITLVLGVILALASGSVPDQSIFVYGGFPLPWLRIILGMPIYDPVGLILDLLFWTFVVFLIITRTKKESQTKKQSQPISAYFKVKLNKKELTKLLIISFSIAFALILISMIIGFIFVSQIDVKTNIVNIGLGFPFDWFHIYHLEENTPVTVEISNWIAMIVDFILYALLCFIFGYLGDVILKNRKLINSFKE